MDEKPALENMRRTFDAASLSDRAKSERVVINHPPPLWCRRQMT